MGLLMEQEHVGAKKFDILLEMRMQMSTDTLMTPT